MKRTEININELDFPSEIQRILSSSRVFDSSCSRQARVFFIEKEQGFYLKKSAKGTLENEAVMDAYFHKKGLSAKVVSYISDEYDWLLTERILGEDCIFEKYLSDPLRLTDTIAMKLRELHETDFSDCPIQNRNDSYIKTAYDNYAGGAYDKDSFPDSFGYKNAEDAMKVIEENKHRLESDVLLHGDYCLPNIMLNDWQFSGFIDLGNGGVGDRHIDLFWGAWTLNFNLHTEKYRERFFDAYGRDKIRPDMLDVIAAFEVFG